MEDDDAKKTSSDALVPANIGAMGVDDDDDEFVHDPDQSPVTKEELRGCALCTAVFIPIILENMAAISGFERSDRTKPCDNGVTSYSCVVQVGGLWVDTSSFVFYCITVSVLIQFILFMGLGAVADHGNWRKFFMLFFSVICAVTGTLFITLYKESLYMLGAVILIVSNVAYGAAFVFFYAYLPALTRHHPEVIAAREEAISKEGTADTAEFHKVSDAVCNTISTHGFGIMYLSAVTQLLIAGGIALGYGDGTRIGESAEYRLYGLPSTYRLQIGVAFACIWFLVFLYMPLKWLKSRPGPPLPRGANYFTYGYIKVYHTLKQVRQLGNLSRFLLAWFVYSDSFSTIVSVAILFARTELQISQTTLLIVATFVPAMAGLGNFLFLWLARLTKWKTRNIVILQCILYSFIPIWGLLGFTSLNIGLKNTWEVWVVTGWHGLLLGATQSSCRVLFSELLPPGKESAFFAFYEITDKGSSWVGPLVVGIIGDATGSKRNAFYFLLVMFILPIFLFWTVDVNKGKLEAAAFLEREKRGRLKSSGEIKTDA
ncbi:Autophagy protein 22 [Borealophlyctis nickersoniae]|nr:Autophagy protein 22 [Borealophlyctis nickersoniae]